MKQIISTFIQTVPPAFSLAGSLALSLAVSSTLSWFMCQSALAQGAENQQTTQSQENLPNHQNLPLRGLTGATSLGVYPQLDKGLLVTPGVHPVKISVPLSQIVQEQTKITAKIERQDAPRGKYQGLLISVTNNADRPLLFDGDAAVANPSAGGTVTCVPLAKLAALSVLPEQSSSLRERFTTDLKATTTAALTVGWYQTIRDQKRGNGPIVAPDGGRYGLDEQRRQDELRRFGKRVLWPGDATTGVIYFDTTAALSGTTIDLPVCSYYDKDDRSSVNLHN